MSDIEVTAATRNGETAAASMDVESPLEGIDISVADVPAEMEAAEAQQQIDVSVGATEPEVAPEGFPEEPKQPELITIKEEKEAPFWGGFFGRP